MWWEGTPEHGLLSSHGKGLLGEAHFHAPFSLCLPSLHLAFSFLCPFQVHIPPIPWDPKAISSQFVPVCVLVASTKYWPKSNMGRKQLIWLTGCSPWSKEAKAGTQKQALKQRQGGYLLPGLLSVVCSACFLCNQGSLVEGWHHPQWASFHRNH